MPHRPNFGFGKAHRCQEISPLEKAELQFFFRNLFPPQSRESIVQ